MSEEKSMSDALQALESQYILLTNNLSSLVAACTTADQKNALMTQYVACRRNYFNCVNQIFHDDDPAVQSLVTQMNKQQATLTTEVTNIQDIAAVINTITTAIQTGVALAAKVG
jgi:hypothetical protein